MDSVGVVILVVLVALAAAGITWLVVRHRYIKSLEAKGWSWQGDVAPQLTAGLNNPPFGLGFDRDVGHHISGTATDGTPFRAFTYRSDQGRESDLVVTMPLPKSLPALWVFSDQPRIGISGIRIADTPATVVTHHQEFGERALAAIRPHLQTQAAASEATSTLELSIDHGHLVMFDAPKDADQLEAAVAQLATIRRALITSSAMAFDGDEPPQHLSFHGRDHWVYIPRDDSYLARIRLTGGGFDHEARDVIVSHNFGLPFLRLHHHWKTRHTRTDAEGRTHTTIRNHDEYLCQFATSFPFRELSVNAGWFSGGQVVRFESTDFNRQFKVRASIPRFASDVIHPRQMEYMLASRGPDFSIEPDGTITVDGGRWFPDEIDAASEYLRGFFRNVPNFVWEELGCQRRPALEIPRTDGPRVS